MVIYLKENKSKDNYKNWFYYLGDFYYYLDESYSTKPNIINEFNNIIDNINLNKFFISISLFDDIVQIQIYDLNLYHYININIIEDNDDEYGMNYYIIETNIINEYKSYKLFKNINELLYDLNNLDNINLINNKLKNHDYK